MWARSVLKTRSWQWNWHNWARDQRSRTVFRPRSLKWNLLNKWGWAVFKVSLVAISFNLVLLRLGSDVSLIILTSLRSHSFNLWDVLCFSKFLRYFQRPALDINEMSLEHQRNAISVFLPYWLIDYQNISFDVGQCLKVKNTQNWWNWLRNTWFFKTYSVTSKISKLFKMSVESKEVKSCFVLC